MTIQHTGNFHQLVFIFESSVPQVHLPHHPQLKPALKLPLSNAINDQFGSADHYIRAQVVPLGIPETDLFQKVFLLVEKININIITITLSDVVYTGPCFGSIQY